jgi:predicted nucleic acid-binding protein
VIRLVVDPGVFISALIGPPGSPRKRLTERATRRQAKTCSSDRASIWLARRDVTISTSMR